MTLERNHTFGEGVASKLNRMEITSICALLAYTAHTQKVSEGLVKEMVVARFGVDDVVQLPRQSYDSVIRYLVDLQIDLLLN